MLLQYNQAIISVEEVRHGVSSRAERKRLRWWQRVDKEHRAGHHFGNPPAEYTRRERNRHACLAWW